MDFLGLSDVKEGGSRKAPPDPQSCVLLYDRKHVAKKKKNIVLCLNQFRKL